MNISERLQWQAAFSDLLEQHCTAGNFPRPQAERHGGYALRGNAGCAVHAICRGELLELVASAGCIPAELAPSSTETAEFRRMALPQPGLLRAADDTIPGSIDPALGSPGFERSEIDPETGQLILRHWLALEGLDEIAFSRAVEDMRQRAELWRIVFELENAR